MARVAGNRSAVGSFSRRQVIAGCATVPHLLPGVSLAVGRPRYRKRRKQALVAPERALFGAEGPPSLAQVHRCIDRLWASLRRHLAQCRGKPPWREADLLAGLALRYDRPDMLKALLAATDGKPGWQPRRAKWSQPDGAWRRRWTREGAVVWSWHHAGVLTRSLLPLKLSS
jgi:hypothetical protein